MYKKVCIVEHTVSNVAADSQTKLKFVNPGPGRVALSQANQKILADSGFTEYFCPAPDGNCLLNCYSQLISGDEFQYADRLRKITARLLYESFQNPDSNEIASLQAYMPTEILKSSSNFDDQLLEYCRRLENENSIYLGEHEIQQLTIFLGLPNEFRRGPNLTPQLIERAEHDLIHTCLVGNHYYLLFKADSDRQLPAEMANAIRTKIENYNISVPLGENADERFDSRIQESDIIERVSFSI